MAEPILVAKDIRKSFTDPVDVEILHGINFSVQKGEFASIIGKSGCGKSTLLYILSTMDTDYKGELWIDGEEMSKKSEKELARVRNKKIGFVFQFHYLLNEFSVLKNVMLPALKLNELSEEEIKEKALKKLEVIGIRNLADKPANQMSRGQKQRVAIARSLINNPAIIMAYVPTVNLDTANYRIVY
jgi:lipoprotein-releasing system ATP-binding protein